MINNNYQKNIINWMLNDNNSKINYQNQIKLVIQ